MSEIIKERYKQIEGYEDYVVTESGEIYSFNFYSHKKPLKLAKKGINNPKRYLQVVLNKNNMSKYVQIHRLVGKAFVDGYFEGAVINHKDANIHNNHYSNLEWVTQKENVHKSYDNSGLNQIRNYKLWKIIYPNNEESIVLKGIGEIKQYVKDNNLQLSITMLQKWKEHNGYKLIEVDRYE